MWLQQRSTFVLVNCQAVRNRLIANEKMDPAKIRVVYNGVQVNGADPSPRFRTAIQPGAAENEKWIVMVANMHARFKGHLDVVRAAATVCAAQSNVRFLLVGDGPERNAIRREIADHGLDGYFVFLKQRRDVGSILGCCDLGILASHTEGLPNVVLEYMAAGLPVVATAVGGVPEMIEHGRHGLLVPPGAPDALAAAILRILSDNALAGYLGRSARNRVQAEFTFERQIAAIEDLYGIGPSGHSIWPRTQPSSDPASISPNAVKKDHTSL